MYCNRLVSIKGALIQETVMLKKKQPKVCILLCVLCRTVRFTKLLSQLCIYKGLFLLVQYLLTSTRLYVMYVVLFQDSHKNVYKYKKDIHEHPLHVTMNPMLFRVPYLCFLIKYILLNIYIYTNYIYITDYMGAPAQ